MPGDQGCQGLLQGKRVHVVGQPGWGAKLHWRAPLTQRGFTEAGAPPAAAPPTACAHPFLHSFTRLCLPHRRACAR